MLDIKNIIRKPYYYVSPCPRCHSHCTGRYVKTHGDIETEWVYRESLRNGEFVINVPEIFEENVFCVSCGFSWPENVKVKLFSLNEIAEQKKLRGTAEILRQEMETLAEVEKEEKKRGGIIRGFKRFIGKI